MAQSSTVFPDHAQNVLTILTQTPEAQWPLLIDNLFKTQKKEVIEACAISLLNLLPITMYGRKIKNIYADSTSKVRKELHIHPYPKQGSGASVTLAYTDPETMETYVLLARKKNDTGQYEQVGGYTKGHWPEGGEIIADKRPEEKKDADEEELLGNKNAVNLSGVFAQEVKLNSNYTLQQIKAAIRLIFTNMLADPSTSWAKLDLDPVEIKQQLQEMGILMQPQFNAEEAAIDETKQETGIDLRQLGKHRRPKRVTCKDDFCIANESEKLHTVRNDFLVNLGYRSEAPKVQPGSDVGELVWVPVSEIQLSNSFSKDARSTYQDKPIRLDYGTVTLSACMNEVRNQQLQWQSRNRFSTSENVEVALYDVLQEFFPLKSERHEYVRSLLGYLPRAEVGMDAHIYYLKVLKVAQFLMEMKDKYLNETQLENLKEYLAEDEHLALAYAKRRQELAEQIKQFHQALILGISGLPQDQGVVHGVTTRKLGNFGFITLKDGVTAPELVANIQQGLAEVVRFTHQMSATATTTKKPLLILNETAYANTNESSLLKDQEGKPQLILSLTEKNIEQFISENRFPETGDFAGLCDKCIRVTTDGFVSNLSESAEYELYFAINTADAPPVILYDAQAGVLGVLACSWHNVAKGELDELIQKMLALGAKSSQIFMGIGPGLGPKSLEFGTEDAKKFYEPGMMDSRDNRFFQGKPSLKQFVLKREENPTKSLLDLPGMLTEIAKAQGIPKEQIYNSGWDSKDSPVFFSARSSTPPEEQKAASEKKYPKTARGITFAHSLATANRKSKNEETPSLGSGLSLSSGSEK